uniref:Uncharacterized protein n=1 Tax=viral metagenome TaxID=1070528 RepID=A0A6M3IFC7_9ZZZZ
MPVYENKEYTAKELCRQYMGRAKETLTIPVQAMDNLVELQVFIERLMEAQHDISYAIFQVGRMMEGDE